MPPYLAITQNKEAESVGVQRFPLPFALSAQWHRGVSIVSFRCSTGVSALGSYSESERAAAQNDPFAIKEQASGVDLLYIGQSLRARLCYCGTVCARCFLKNLMKCAAAGDAFSMLRTTSMISL